MHPVKDIQFIHILVRSTGGDKSSYLLLGTSLVLYSWKLSNIPPAGPLLRRLDSGSFLWCPRRESGVQAFCRRQNLGGGGFISPPQDAMGSRAEYSAGAAFQYPTRWAAAEETRQRLLFMCMGSIIRPGDVCFGLMPVSAALPGAGRVPPSGGLLLSLNKSRQKSA